MIDYSPTQAHAAADDAIMGSGAEHKKRIILLVVVKGCQASIPRREDKMSETRRYAAAHISVTLVALQRRQGW